MPSRRKNGFRRLLSNPFSFLKNKGRRFPSTSRRFEVGPYNLKLFHSKDISDRFRLVKKLGSGSYGEAYLYEIRKTRQPLVIKKISLKENERLDQSVAEFANYKKLLQLKGFKHFVKQYDMALLKDSSGYYHLLIMQEYVENGDFLKYAKDYTNIDWMRLAIQLFRTMGSFHKFGFVHRDIHARNIFIDNDGNLKIGDFGLSCFRGLCGGSADHVKPNDPLVDIIDACILFVGIIPHNDPDYDVMYPIMKKAFAAAYCAMRRKGYDIHKHIRRSRNTSYKFVRAGHWKRAHDMIVAGEMELDDYQPPPKHCDPVSAHQIANILEKLY